MKKDKEKSKDKDQANSEPAKIPQVHDISGRIPTMSDPELNTLLGNARRLHTSGSAIQKKTAEFLLPLVEEELANRLAAKEAAKKARVSKRKKAPAAAEAASDSE